MEPDGNGRLRVFVGALRSVAHELHGKLTVARSLVGANSAAQAQLQHLEDLLEEMGRLGQRASMVAVDLSPIVEGIVAEAGARPKWRGVTFSWMGSSGQSTYGDGRLIARAIRALVGNAADACAAAGSGTVSVSIVAHNHFLDIAVRQTAPLPDRDELDRLLEPNFSSSKRTLAVGTGIPTVCAIAEAHDGLVMADADSDAMVLRLPVSRGEV